MLCTNEFVLSRGCAYITAALIIRSHGESPYAAVRKSLRGHARKSLRQKRPTGLNRPSSALGGDLE